MKTMRQVLSVGMVVLFAAEAAWGGPVSNSAITYQGQLTLNGQKVNQPCDFEFCLFDAATGGTELACESVAGLSVDAGVFTALLNFGTENLQTDPLWLQITANCTGSSITVAPRQQITAAPFALHTKGIAVDDDNNASVNGVIESTTGGFKFPDGTTMVSANQLVPIGTVVDFYLDPIMNPVPNGWEVCDGEPVQDPDSPITGMAKPDFTTPRYARGTSDPALVGGTGGALVANLSYTSGSEGPSSANTGSRTVGTAPVGSNTNSVSLATNNDGGGTSGNRAVTINPALGNHSHKWAETKLAGSSVEWVSFNSSGNTVQATWAFSAGPLTGGDFPMMVSTPQINPPNPPDLYTNNTNLSHSHTSPAHNHSTPAHSHGIAAHSHSVNNHSHGGLPHDHTMNHTHLTDHNVDVSLPEPPYVGMLKIIKVK